MLLLIFWIIFIMVIIRVVITLFWSLVSFCWLKKEFNLVSKENSNDYDFILLIPVLREQKVLSNTIDYLLNLRYNLNKIKIILVSTEKEFSEALKGEEKTTIDVIKEIKSRIKEKYNLNIIEHLHCPIASGRVADQLNYAFEYIFKTYRGNINSLFIGIYNADSRPNLFSLNYISREAKLKNYRVFQQSGVFLDNFNSMSDNNSFVSEKLLKANAILQTRWTFAHEIPRMLMQSFSINKFRTRFFLAHCISHGLFLRGDLLFEMQKMPSHTVTEDLFLGYNLSLLGESINPIPLLESAEMPNKLMMALKQKYVWFFGPLDHFAYKKFFIKSFPQKASLPLINWMTFQGIVPAFAWFFSGWMIVYIIIYPVVSGNLILSLLGLMAFIVYGPLSYILVMIHSDFLFRAASQKNLIKKQDYFWVSFFSLPIIILHSIPPIFAVLAEINYFISKKEPFKPKTER